MEKNPKLFIVYNNKSEEGVVDNVISQHVMDIDENGDERMQYFIRNMNDCADDCVIGRSLPDADWWISAVEYGIMLGREGYDGVTVETRDRWDATQPTITDFVQEENADEN